MRHCNPRCRPRCNPNVQVHREPINDSAPAIDWNRQAARVEDAQFQSQPQQVLEQQPQIHHKRIHIPAQVKQTQPQHVRQSKHAQARQRRSNLNWFKLIFRLGMGVGVLSYKTLAFTGKLVFKTAQVTVQVSIAALKQGLKVTNQISKANRQYFQVSEYQAKPFVPVARTASAPLPIKVTQPVQVVAKPVQPQPLVDLSTLTVRKREPESIKVVAKQPLQMPIVIQARQVENV